MHVSQIRQIRGNITSGSGLKCHPFTWTFTQVLSVKVQIAVLEKDCQMLSLNPRLSDTDALGRWISIFTDLTIQSVVLMYLYFA